MKSQMEKEKRRKIRKKIFWNNVTDVLSVMFYCRCHIDDTQL